MNDLEQLVSDTRALSGRWRKFYDDTDTPEAGAVVVVLSALTGALLSGHLAAGALRRCADGAATAASINLQELTEVPC